MTVLLNALVVLAGVTVATVLLLAGLAASTALILMANGFHPARIDWTIRRVTTDHKTTKGTP